MISRFLGCNLAVALTMTSLLLAFPASAQENLFEQVGVPNTVALPEHAVAAQPIRINRRALRSPTMHIDLFGEQVTAVREQIENHRAGEFVWIGHLQGNPDDRVIITLRANSFSGLIQRGGTSYQISVDSFGKNRLLQLQLEKLPPDDAADLPDGQGAVPGELDQGATAADGNTVQGLLVVYTQGACNSAGGCSQLEADITTAVADLNSAYAASNITITMNLVGTALTNYSGINASQALSDLRGTSDGQMDEIHPLRDQLGADIVALIYDGQGCGIGYLGSSASYAFSVTDEPCLVGNRTMAHEIGHNQGAHHDRATVGGGNHGAYNYGYRRCNDSSADNHGSPYFRTVLSYSCSGAARVGRFSNPDVNYSGVPQGVDPYLDPAKGAFNARTLNESASYIAGFRTITTPPTLPAAPGMLDAQPIGPDSIALSWADNADNEDNIVVQSSPDSSNWTTIATLAANSTSFTDNGLSPETLYYYRVYAQNSAGSSNYSNVASATTDPQPPVVVDLAQADLLFNGTVTGGFSATHVADGAVQTFTELHSGGPKRSRKQSYRHGWRFNVTGGAGGSVVSVNAWVSGSEGANFYYSLDGGNSRQLMFSINTNSPAPDQTFTLPPGTAGSVDIEIEDAEKANGEAVDSAYVDLVQITSYADPGTPPVAPSDLVINSTTSSSVSMVFTDNADNEFGFEIWRSQADPGTDCDAGSLIDTLGAQTGTGPVSFVDTGTAAQTSYWYWAKAFNVAGNDGLCSNAAMATTTAAPAISLTITSTYKVKGIKHVDLSWAGITTASVDIRRDSTLITTVPNTGEYTDNIGSKGGGNYNYQVCEQGSTSSCSAVEAAVF